MGVSKSRTSPQMKDPPEGSVFPLRRPFPRISETTSADANSKRFIQIHRYLGRLSLSKDQRAHRRNKQSFYGLGSKGAAYKSEKHSYRVLIG